MKKYILYAEDDPDDFWLLSQAFAELNSDLIELVNVPDGYDVIRYLQELDVEKFPSLILLDLVMPTLSGSETLSYLKMDDRFKNIPVVCISTSSNPKEQEDIAKTGSTFVQKPHLYEEWIGIANDLAKYCSIFILCGLFRN